MNFFNNLFDRTLEIESALEKAVKVDEMMGQKINEFLKREDFKMGGFKDVFEEIIEEFTKLVGKEPNEEIIGILFENAIMRIFDNLENEEKEHISESVDKVEDIISEYAKNEEDEVNESNQSSDEAPYVGTIEPVEAEIQVGTEDKAYGPEEKDPADTSFKEYFEDGKRYWKCYPLGENTVWKDRGDIKLMVKDGSLCVEYGIENENEYCRLVSVISLPLESNWNTVKAIANKNGHLVVTVQPTVPSKNETYDVPIKFCD